MRRFLYIWTTIWLLSKQYPAKLLGQCMLRCQNPPKPWSCDALVGAQSTVHRHQCSSLLRHFSGLLSGCWVPEHLFGWSSSCIVIPSGYLCVVLKSSLLCHLTGYHSTLFFSFLKHTPFWKSQSWGRSQDNTLPLRYTPALLGHLWTCTERR